MSLNNKIEEREILHSDADVEIENRKKVIEDVGASRRQGVNKVIQFVWLLFGILEAAIGLRVFLKLITANPGNPFAQLVYSFTDLFLWPFAGLTSSPSAGGFTLEIPSVIAMIVYAIMAWVLANLDYICQDRLPQRYDYRTPERVNKTH